MSTNLQALMTVAERRQYRGTARLRRLDEVYATLPHVREYVAAALAGSSKRGWYDRAQSAIWNQYGPDAPRFTYLLAAMSPRVSLQINVRNAMAVWVSWTKAGRPTSKGAIMAAAMAADIGEILPAWINNMVRALTESGHLPRLSGPKVASFAANLSGDLDEVTNDGWQALFAGIAQARFGGTLNDSGPGKSAYYLAASIKCRAAALVLTKITGKYWYPAEVQETVWSFTKTAYEYASSCGPTVSVVDLVKSGALTDALLGATPDLHSVMAAVASQATAVPERMRPGLRKHLLNVAKRIDVKLNERRGSGEEPNF